MGTAIEVQGLTKSFGTTRIWEDISLSLPKVRSVCYLARRVPAKRSS
jgi:ABC-type transporter Mla maintaining outer membrane lipid asymmetry ATPase subunit MlaF